MLSGSCHSEYQYEYVWNTCFVIIFSILHLRLTMQLESWLELLLLQYFGCLLRAHQKGNSFKEKGLKKFVKSVKLWSYCIILAFLVCGLWSIISQYMYLLDFQWVESWDGGITKGKISVYKRGAVIYCLLKKKRCNSFVLMTENDWQFSLIGWICWLSAINHHYVCWW